MQAPTAARIPPISSLTWMTVVSVDEQIRHDPENENTSREVVVIERVREYSKITPDMLGRGKNKLGISKPLCSVWNLNPILKCICPKQRPRRFLLGPLQSWPGLQRRAGIRKFQTSLFKRVSLVN
jgi:hypothetical protein